MSGSDVLAGVLDQAPELQNAPDLAVAASNTPDPTGTGRVLAHTVRTNAQDQAVQNVSKKIGGDTLTHRIGNAGFGALHRTLGWFGGSVSQAFTKANDTLEQIPGVKTLDQDIGDIGSGALRLANVPLQEVQHTYRALHDIEARHGAGVALLEGLGIAAGAAGAVVLAPATGGGSLAAFGGVTVGILGGEATADIASRVLYRDSWDRTLDGPAYRGIYNRQTGRYSGGPVSLGRDLTDHLPHPLRFMSGVTDELADLALDPVAQFGGAFAEARKAGLAVNTVDQLDSALSSPLTGGIVRRAFEDIASESSATSIGLRYPKFTGIAEDLAKRSTADDVTEYFRSILGAAEHLDAYPGELPNLPLTRIPFKAAREFMQTYNGPGQAALRVFTLLPTDFDPKLMAYSNKDFDPTGTSWQTGVYRALRFGSSDTTARAVTDAMLATDDLGVRRGIFKNGIVGMMKARGLTEDDEFFRNVVQKLENTTPLEGGPEGVYAVDAAGRNLSLIPGETGNRAVAVFENQTGRWAFPDYMEMTRAIRAKGAITDLLGGVDDAFYHHFTQNIFKRGALLTGGFALRIAAAEAIPAAFREGFFNLIRNSVNLHLGALEAKIGAEEGGHIAAAVQRMLGGVSKITLSKPEDVDLFTRATIDNGGHIVVKGLDADAHGAAGVSFLDTPEGNHSTLLQRLFKKVPPGKRYGNEFGIFGTGPDHADTWQKALAEAGNSELGQTAARTLHGQLAAGRTVDEATQSATDAVRNVLDGKDAKWLGQYERHFTSSTPGVTPHDDWGRVITESVKGLVGHPYDPSSIKMDLLEGIAGSGTAGAPTVGAYVRAADRANIGRVLSINEDARTARVHFVNKAEGLAATVELPLDQLTGQTGGGLHGNLSLSNLKAVPAAERPMVKGRIEMPAMPDSPTAKIAQLGYTHVIDPIINFLSREPLYATELKRQYAPLRALIADGVLAEDEALRLAQIRTVKAVVPFIHNPLERSQFAQLARNFMPFYFAQTQAYRRVGRLLAENPGAFRKFQLASTALHDIGTVTTDDNGKPQFVYPGSGFLAHASIAALGGLGFQVAGSTPVAFSGDVRSLNTIFPFNEESGGIGVGPFTAKFGPIVSIPLHALESMFPEVGVPIATKVLGPVGAAGGMLDQFIPNTPIRNYLKAAGWIPGGQRELQNAMVQTIQSLTYRQQEAMTAWVNGGHQPTDPGHPTIVPLPSDAPLVRQQFVDRVRNQSRILLFLKASLSLVVPAAPAVSASDLGLQKELRDLIVSKGPDGKPLGIGGAVTEYLAKHPDAVPYTVFGSASDAGGAYLPANKSAQDFIDTHLDTLKKYPYAGAWLIPQTADPYDQSVYNQQLAMGLRHKKAPEQFVKDIYIAQGNDQFYNKDLPAHQAAMAAAAGDPAAEKQERSNFNAYLANVLGPQNPVWWDDFQSKDRQHERENAVRQLEQMFQNGDAPPGEQTSKVKSLLDDYRTYNAAKIAGRQDQWTALQRDEEKANWQAYIDRLAKDDPAIAPIALKVFRSL